jgi:hypothetical protein
MPLQTTSALCLAVRMRALFIFRIAMNRLWDLSFGIHMVTSLYSQFLLSVTMKNTASRVSVSVFNTSRHFRTYAVVHVPEGPAQVGIEYACVQLCMYIQGRPGEIQTLTHRNLIGRTTTALPFVLSPSSMLRPPSSPCIFFPARKIPREFQKMLSVFIIACLKLRNSGSVCTPYRSRLFCLDRRQVFRTSCP